MFESTPVTQKPHSLSKH